MVSNVLDVILLVANITGPAAVIIDVIVALLSIALTCLSNGAKTYSTVVFYDSDLNGASPMPVQFKRVEVSESPGGVGKTVHEFTSTDNYTLWEASNTIFSSKQRFAPWAYGLPLRTSVYGASGNILKQTENTYDLTNVKTRLFFWLVGKQVYARESCKCMVNNSYSQKSTDWINPSNYSANYLTLSNTDMGVEIYPVYTGRMPLVKTAERTYRPTDATQYVETQTTYDYNYLYNYEPFLITTTQSNGDVIRKAIKYSTDYSGGALTTIVQNNMVTVPVAVSTYVNRVVGGVNVTQMLSEKVTEFTQLPNGDIKPSRTLEQRFSQPASSYTTYGGPGSAVSNYIIPQTFTYGSSGVLTGIKDEGNRSITNIYDYNDKYVVATVINADPATDNTAYTSFETPNYFGGWTFAGTAYYTGTSAVTGASALSLATGNSLSANLNPAKPYTLSFWSSSGSVNISPGATQVKFFGPINGFSFYEYVIPQGTASISLSGTGNIDELRLYPQNARMRTTTYDPLIGKTSECDENNRISYYTYDNLGRLQFIKDEKGNIVKAYEYNNVSASKRNGCPNTYSNHLISETFTRANCGSNYLGGNITVTVPSGAYTSVISQADADAQAENYLLASGQTNADATGTCSLIYYNTAQSVADSIESCATGYKGGLVTYTVPAGRYWSIFSQADADQQASDDIAANAQAWANNPANQSSCVIDYSPDWEWDNVSTYCLSVNGTLPPHLFVLEKDVNPNSPSYNQTRWSDVGTDNACPANTYYNASQSQVFTRNNCPSGYVGSNVTYTVPPGKYSSTVSQAAADQQATNDINANGQNYANANGTCSVPLCNGSLCSGEDKKCISNYCETGVKVYTNSVYHPSSNSYTCTYHYEWSDATWSPDYLEINPNPCAI
jgi:hypothetical protein